MTEALLGEFEEQISSFTLIPSSGGAFEITVDGGLIYSKKATGRHAEVEEVKEALRQRMGQ